MKKGIVLSIASFSMFTSILLNIDKIGCFKGVSNKSNYEMIESVSASAKNDPSVSHSVFTITEKAPTRAFSWLKRLLALSHLRHY